MKVIIAGSRSLTRYSLIERAMNICPFRLQITEVVSGLARGIDRLGITWAEIHGIPVKKFPAEWKKHGNSAGPIRNAQMAYYADALVAIWDGESTGTANMVEQMEAHHKPWVCYTIENRDKMDVFVESFRVPLKKRDRREVDPMG